MVKIEKYLKQLDDTLHFLCGKNVGSFIWSNQINLTNKMDDLGIKEDERLPVLIHLFKEDYIEFYDAEKVTKAGQFPEQLKVTYKGLIFNSLGGYVQQEADRQSLLAEQESLKTLEKRLKEKAVEQNRQLILVAIVGAVWAFGSLVIQTLELLKATPSNSVFLLWPFWAATLFFVIRWLLQKIDW